MAMDEKKGHHGKSTSQISEKCQKCPFLDKCDKKRMEACAFIIPEPMSSPAVAGACAPIMEDIIVKHNYRNVKIGPSTTATIDLEEIKKQLKRDFYKSIGCPSFQFGAYFYEK